MSIQPRKARLSPICDAKHLRQFWVVDAPFRAVLSGGIDNLERPCPRVSRFALLLRCLLIVAFCLDGSVGVWRSTAMAAERAGHAVTTTPHADSHSVQLATALDADHDCGDTGTTRSAQSSEHGDCDCTKNDCSCACAFTGIAFTHVVPFAAQHIPSAEPGVILRPETAREVTSTVFRPPIG